MAGKVFNKRRVKEVSLSEVKDNPSKYLRECSGVVERKRPSIFRGLSPSSVSLACRVAAIKGSESLRDLMAQTLSDSRGRGERS